MSACITCTAKLELLDRIHESVRSEHADCARFLLSSDPAKVNERDIEGSAAIHHAAATGNEEIIGLLIGFNAKLDQSNKDGMTPFQVAESKGHNKAASYIRMLESSASDSPPDEAILEVVAEVVEDLVSEAEKVDSPLIDAVKAQDLAAATAILASDTSIVSDVDSLLRRTALHYAAESGKEDMIALLLGAGAKLHIRDVNGETPEEVYYQTQLAAAPHQHRKISVTNKLCYAVSRNDLSKVVSILESSADDKGPLLRERDQASGFMPLHLASEQGSWHCTAELIEFGFDVNAIAGDGETALLKAVEKGSLPCVVLLLKGGAKIDVIGRLACGNTPVHAAAAAGRRDILNALYAKQPDAFVESFYHPDGTGATPVTLAETAFPDSTAKWMRGVHEARLAVIAADTSIVSVASMTIVRPPPATPLPVIHAGDAVRLRLVGGTAWFPAVVRRACRKTGGGPADALYDVETTFDKQVLVGVLPEYLMLATESFNPDEQVQVVLRNADGSEKELVDGVVVRENADKTYDLWRGGEAGSKLYEYGVPAADLKKGGREPKTTFVELPEVEYDLLPSRFVADGCSLPPFSPQLRAAVMASKKATDKFSKSVWKPVPAPAWPAPAWPVA